jgi:hypothetical protein
VIAISPHRSTRLAFGRLFAPLIICAGRVWASACRAELCLRASRGGSRLCVISYIVFAARLTRRTRSFLLGLGPWKFHPFGAFHVLQNVLTIDSVLGEATHASHTCVDEPGDGPGSGLEKISVPQTSIGESVRQKVLHSPTREGFESHVALYVRSVRTRAG